MSKENRVDEWFQDKLRPQDWRCVCVCVCKNPFRLMFGAIMIRRMVSGTSRQAHEYKTKTVFMI